MKYAQLLLLGLSTALAQVSPGGREGHVMEQTDSNTLYIFGGTGRGSSDILGYLNDVWKYDIPSRKFSFVKGSQAINRLGTYGSSPSPDNQPGGRISASSTLLRSKIYVFGGLGFAASSGIGYLADLWSFDPSTAMWLYLGGSQSRNDVSVYGGPINGPPYSYSTEFRPGGRFGSGMAYNRNETELIFYGGYGRDNAVSKIGNVGDVWFFRLRDSTWAYRSGNFNSSGTMSGPPSNYRPGSRYSMSFKCVPGEEMCYIFGGWGYNNGAAIGYLNDLWSFNQTSGMFAPLYRGNYNNADVSGIYGTKGTEAPENTPGCRFSPASFFDSVNNRIIVYGGLGLISRLEVTYNDIWSFNVSSGNWAWISGDNALDQKALANRPGARMLHAIASNSSTSFYLFGGKGYGYGLWGHLNDLWYHSIPDSWNLDAGSLTLNLPGDYLEESETKTEAINSTTTVSTTSVSTKVPRIAVVAPRGSSFLSADMIGIIVAVSLSLVACVAIAIACSRSRRSKQYESEKQPTYTEELPVTQSTRGIVAKIAD